MTVCFSGHRASKLCGWDSSKYTELKTQLVELVENLANQDYDTFITGGAQGIDQLVFWAVNEVKKTRPNITNWVISPFPGHESRWAKYGLFSQDEYQKMLKAADKVTMTMYTKPNTSRGIGTALTIRNIDMLHNSQALCAFMNQEELNDPYMHSGTKNCIDAARRANMRVFIHEYDITDLGMTLK